MPGNAGHCCCRSPESVAVWQRPLACPPGRSKLVAWTLVSPELRDEANQKKRIVLPSLDSSVSRWRTLEAHRGYRRIRMRGVLRMSQRKTVFAAQKNGLQ